jgi:hypothetical protein
MSYVERANDRVRSLLDAGRVNDLVAARRRRLSCSCGWLGLGWGSGTRHLVESDGAHRVSRGCLGGRVMKVAGPCSSAPAAANAPAATRTATRNAKRPLSSPSTSNGSRSTSTTPTTRVRFEDDDGEVISQWHREPDGLRWLYRDQARNIFQVLAAESYS